MSVAGPRGAVTRGEEGERLAVERVEIAPGYTVPRWIQGCWQLSAGHGSRALDEETLLRRLLERTRLGFDTFDCADIYTGVEELLRRLLAGLGAHLGAAHGPGPHEARPRPGAP